MEKKRMRDEATVPEAREAEEGPQELGESQTLGGVRQGYATGGASEERHLQAHPIGRGPREEDEEQAD